MKTWASFCFGIGAFLWGLAVVHAEFTIDTFRLSKVDISGVNDTLAVYFKVCFVSGTKGVKVTTYYGDDAGTTGRVELSSSSYTTMQSCIDTGISMTFGKTVIKGARFVHVKFEQTGGPIKWDQANLNVLGSPEIGFIGLPTISKTSASIGDQLKISFQLKNSGSTKSDIISEVKVLYAFIANDVIDVQKAKMFAASVPVPKIDAITNLTTQSDLTFNVPIPDKQSNGAPYTRLYLAVFIDPNQNLIDANRGNNYKTFTVNYLLPDLAVTSVVITPNPVSGAYANGKPTGTYQIDFAIKNEGQGASVVDLFGCLPTFIDKKGGLTLTGTVATKPIPALAPGGTWSGTFAQTIPLDAGGGGFFVQCGTEDKESLDTKRTNNEKDASGQLSEWYDYSLHSFSVSPTKAKPGDQVTVRYSITHEGNTAVTARFSIALVLSGLSLVYLKQDFSVPSARFGTYNFQEVFTLPTTLKAGSHVIGMAPELASIPNDANSQNHDLVQAPLLIITDQDKDGFTSDVDCNDNDKAVNPQAPELCDGIDNNCNKQIDEGCTCQQGAVRPCYTGSSGCILPGGTGPYLCTTPCQTGQQVCNAGSWGACVGEVLPSPEVCDGVDNDCDFFVDDGLSPVACYTGPSNTKGVGECRSGEKKCVNGKLTACLNEVTPQPELCDGKDNDCDGATDEDFATKGGPCDVGTGACLRSGIFVCAQGGAKLECSAKPAPPALEICDGLDNDCDGIIDNIAANACYSGDAATRGKLPCKDGTEVCDKGKLICKGEKAPTAESCNNIDDDCNGMIDDGVTEDCYSGPAATRNIGVCSDGKKTCNAGKFGPCVGDVTPKAETCDGVDENCNGQVDDGVSRSCYTGPNGTVDVGLCRAGVDLCIAGKFSGVCSGEVKPQTEVCDGLDNDCNGQSDDIPGCQKTPEPASEGEPEGEPLTEPDAEPDGASDGGADGGADQGEPVNETDAAAPQDISTRDLSGGSESKGGSDTQADAPPLGVGCSVGGPSFPMSVVVLFLLLTVFVRRPT